MGTWGAKLYQDDLAQDIKETYIDMLKQGKDNKEITKKLIEEYVNNLDAEETSIFWLTLSDIQWDYGRLIEEVKEEALKHIKSGENLNRWKEEGTEKEYMERKQVLEELEQKLKSAMPAEKKIRKKKPYICPWEIGDVFAYKLTEEGEKYIACIKVGEGKYGMYDICPIVYVYNKIFDKIPELEELKSVKYLPQGFRPRAYRENYKDIVYKCLIGIENSTKKYANKFRYIGNSTNYAIPYNEKHDEIEINNSYLCIVERFRNEQTEIYEEWKDIDYWN